MMRNEMLSGETSRHGVAVINMYAAREPIYPRQIKGRYATLRWLCVWLTQCVFYGLPWLEWNGRQAVLFDIAQRKFYLFGIVLWPQDFIYLAALLILCAYLLFLVTAVAGRAWCGFACPQSVYTEIFLWIERKAEGSRSARMRRDAEPPSAARLARKTAKHVAWGVVAIWTGFTFVGYFAPIEILWIRTTGLTLGPWEVFWILFYGFATYGNAGWMREQLCKYICPYARFQASMFDRDTLIVSYDKARGEPRGAKSRKENGKGDCIDCTMCVQVCPTGIDIRNGLQHECISCAACIDACNTVMDKTGAQSGLIRYTTEHALAQQLSTAQIARRAIRPRVIVYGSMLLVFSAVFFAMLLSRTPLKLDVIRDRGAMGREAEDGIIENVYRLQIMNTDERAHRYRIAVSGIPGITLDTRAEVSVDPTAVRALPVRVRIEQGMAKGGSNQIAFKLQAIDDARLQVTEKAVFFVPR